MGSYTSKPGPPVAISSKIPLFCLKKLGHHHILVAGGGGESKTGVLNLIEAYFLKFDCRRDLKRPALMEAVLVDTVDTEIYATMNMDVICTSKSGKKRYLIAAAHGQYCDLYETMGFDGETQNTDDKHLKSKFRNVLRLSTGKVESFQKCVRFDRSTSGKRVVTGSEDGHIRVWNLHALVEDGDLDIVHEPLHDIEAHNSDVFDLDVTEDGSLIISVGHDGIAKMWNLDLGTFIVEVPFPKQCSEGYKVRSVKCVPNSSCLMFIAAYNAVPSSSKRNFFLALWTYDREQFTFQSLVVRDAGKKDGVSSLCVSSCGNFTGLGTMGGSVYIYGTHEMKQLISFEETHSIFVTAVEFFNRNAPDVAQVSSQASNAGLFLVSLSADQTVQIHSLPTDEFSPTALLLRISITLLFLYLFVWWLIRL